MERRKFLGGLFAVPAAAIGVLCTKIFGQEVPKTECEKLVQCAENLCIAPANPHIAALQVSISDMPSNGYFSNEAKIGGIIIEAVTKDGISHKYSLIDILTALAKK